MISRHCDKPKACNSVFLFQKDQREKKMKEKNFLNAEDVAEFMDISVPTAYKIIKKLNDELKQLGYITVAGKISRRFFETKVYGAA